MKYNKIIKDALILFVITLIAGVALGFVYEITKEPIKQAQATAKQEAYLSVFGDAKSFEKNDKLDGNVKQYEAILIEGGYSNISIDEALEAKDSSGNGMGVVLAVTTKEGYGGDITITLGIDNDKLVKGVEILSISETAGLGMKAKNEEFKSQYKEKSVEQFIVTKTGATTDSEIDAISGATITSNAVTGAVNGGIYFVNAYFEIGGEQ